MKNKAILMRISAYLLSVAALSNYCGPIACSAISQTDSSKCSENHDVASKSFFTAMGALFIANVAMLKSALNDNFLTLDYSPEKVLTPCESTELGNFPKFHNKLKKASKTKPRKPTILVNKLINQESNNQQVQLNTLKQNVQEVEEIQVAQEAQESESEQSLDNSFFNNTKHCLFLSNDDVVTINLYNMMSRNYKISQKSRITANTFLDVSPDLTAIFTGELDRYSNQTDCMLSNENNNMIVVCVTAKQDIQRAQRLNPQAYQASILRDFNYDVNQKIQTIAKYNRSINKVMFLIGYENSELSPELSNIMVENIENLCNKNNINLACKPMAVKSTKTLDSDSQNNDDVVLQYKQAIQQITRLSLDSDL